jgi:very-short-patch-repair endonuclease
VISGATSAEFWDVPIIGARHNSLALNPTLYVDPATGVRDGLRDGVRVVHALLGSEDVWEGEVHAPRGFAGNRYRVCMPLRTAVDITRHLRLSEPAVVAVLVAAQRRHAALLDGWVPALAPHSHSGERARAPSDGRAHSRLTEGLKDAALREALRQELLDVVLRSPRRGLRQVVAALPMVDPLLETALESISWSYMCRSGLPLPLLQQWVTGASGKRYRVDFLWPEFRLIGEADGAVKYRSADDVMAEKERHGDLGDAGHGLVRWTWRDAWETQAFLARIERAMGRAGHR